MARQYVTDIIGEEYKTWEDGDQIIIATPTGSGKTTFVVSKLLKQAAAQGKHVVYYCNRRVLHDQFEAQAPDTIKQFFGPDSTLTEIASNYLHILTYQGAELSEKYPSIHFKVKEAHDVLIDTPKQDDGLHVRIRGHQKDEYQSVDSSEIMYYIFDEAHYYLSDSLIRSEGNFWVKQDLHHGISVFLTATPKPLHLFLAIHDQLPFSNDFTHVYNLDKAKSKAETQYYKYENAIAHVLNAWKVYDNVSFALKPSHERYTAFKHRWGGPLQRYFAYVEQVLEDSMSHQHYYRVSPDYSYLDVHYFVAYEELLHQVALTPEDKWIIFVDSEKDGEALLQMIHDLKLGSAAFLSSKRIPEKAAAKAVYDHIVQHQCFPCRILISTSVMDCGTNIHDPEVRHMAIAADSETTFLQELGRKRIAEGERLQLYIRTYTYNQIHTRYNLLYNDLMFMVKLGLKNDLRDSYNESFLTKGELNQLLTERGSSHRRNLSCPEKILSYAKSKHEHLRNENLPFPYMATNVGTFLGEITYSKTAMAHIVHRLYDYNQALVTYYEEIGLGKDLVDFVYNAMIDIINIPTTFATKGDQNIEPSKLDQWISYYVPRNLSPWNEFLLRWKKMLEHKTDDGKLNFDLTLIPDKFFYLKHQLKWIGKEYDPSCWLFSAQKRLELISFLDAACESRPLRQGGAYHEQDDFAEQCKDLMLTLPVPPQQLHRNRSRYKDGKLPSINLLNKYLLELDLPYEIDNNKQERFEGVDKKKTVWTVKRKGPENTPEEERSSPE